jgi:hypothetical protein
MIEHSRLCCSLLLIFIVLKRCSSFVASEEFEIRYSLPRIIMKLIIVDENVQIEQFKLEIDKIAQLHLVNFFMDDLPTDALIVNRNQFRSITLTSTIERVPVEIQDNTTSLTLSVMRSEFTGFGNFSVSEDEVATSVLSKDLINNTTDLRLYVFDAFRQRIGFWYFADLIKANNLLELTGKLQIMVDNVIVAEADLNNDNPDDTNDNSKDGKNLSRLAIVLIIVTCVVVACVGGLGALIWYLRHREYEIEKKSRERRETSKQVRIKSLGNSSSSFGNSIRSNGDVSIPNESTVTAGVPKRLERKTSMTSLASLDFKADIHCRVDSVKNDSDDSLLDSIANESTNLEYETTTQPKNLFSKNYQDDDDSEFCSVQSASERDDHADITPNHELSQNFIVSRTEIRPTKRLSHTSIGTAPPTLKPAIKNSQEGRQYVTDATRKYISYNNNSFAMSSSFVSQSSPRSAHKFVGKQKMANLSLPVSIKRGSITSNKSLLPPLSPTITSGLKGSVDESLKKGKGNNIERFDDGIMLQMSSSNLSFDIMDCSNTGSDQASLSPGKVTKTDNAADDDNQRSLPFYFT